MFSDFTILERKISARAIPTHAGEELAKDGTFTKKSENL